MDDAPLGHSGDDTFSASSHSSRSSRSSFYFDVDTGDVLDGTRGAALTSSRNPEQTPPDPPFPTELTQSPAAVVVGRRDNPICTVEMPAVMRPRVKPQKTGGGDSSSTSGSDRSGHGKLSGLASKNFHVLTPDKRVMLSLPPDCIVPTAGSEKYLERNRNKLVFSFCLCYVYSLGETCHHGSNCDFIHCQPDKLPQVVNMAPLQTEDVRRAIGEEPEECGSTSPPCDSSGSSSAGAVRSFPVHWSAPVASLVAAPYARLPPGRQLYVKESDAGRADSGGHRGTRVIPSDMLYETVGSLKAMNQANGNVPLRVCKHYRREKCARGPLCHFAHPVVLQDAMTGAAASAAPRGRVVYDLGSVPQGSALLDTISRGSNSSSHYSSLPVFSGRDDGSDIAASAMGSRSGSDNSVSLHPRGLHIQNVQPPSIFFKQPYVQFPSPQRVGDFVSSPVESHGSGYGATPPPGVGIVAASCGSSPTQSYVPVLVPASTGMASPFSGSFMTTTAPVGQGMMVLQPSRYFAQAGGVIPVLTEAPSAPAVLAPTQPWGTTVTTALPPQQAVVLPQRPQQPPMAPRLVPYAMFHPSATTCGGAADGGSREGSPHTSFQSLYMQQR